MGNEDQRLQRQVMERMLQYKEQQVGALELHLKVRQGLDNMLARARGSQEGHRMGRGCLQHGPVLHLF